MRHAKRCSCIAVVGLFVLHAVFSSYAYAVAREAVEVMTLADGAKVAMTQAQLHALVIQPGRTYYGPTRELPKLTARQIAIPVPTSIGGGFIVGESAAIAVGMNAVGVTSTATGRNVACGTAAAGVIRFGADAREACGATGAAGAGAAAGGATTGGISGGTIAVGAGIAAAVAVAVAAAGGGGGGGGGSSSSTTTSHH
jgi:hypothetical protein